jgi:hypothetical protein
MDAKVVEKLRRNQSLHELPDGREGLDVTLQFVGDVPDASRRERRDWLERRFSTVQRQFGERVGVKPGSLSVSAQTVEAVVPLDEFDELCEQLSREDVRLAVNVSVQVLDPRAG